MKHSVLETEIVEVEYHYQRRWQDLIASFYRKTSLDARSLALKIRSASRSAVIGSRRRLGATQALELRLMTSLNATRRREETLPNSLLQPPTASFLHSVVGVQLDNSYRRLHAVRAATPCGNSNFTV